MCVSRLMFAVVYLHSELLCTNMCMQTLTQNTHYRACCLFSSPNFCFIRFLFYFYTDIQNWLMHLIECKWASERVQVCVNEWERNFFSRKKRDWVPHTTNYYSWPFVRFPCILFAINRNSSEYTFRMCVFSLFSATEDYVVLVVTIIISVVAVPLHKICMSCIFGCRSFRIQKLFITDTLRVWNEDIK